MTIQSAWSVIVSSRSGGGKARHDWPEIANLLKTKSIEYKEKITDHACHAVELAREALREGFRKLLVVGGDGAMHEVLNGLYSQAEVPPSSVLLGLIPVGSGNDWSRLHRIPADYRQAVELIAAADRHTRVQDVACVRTRTDGVPCKRYMVNIGGLGFDSEVCRRFDRAKAKGHAGDRQYLKSLLSGFLSYKPLRFHVTVDGADFYDGTAFSVALGIGRYCGGGMRQTPDAIPDDGLINVTVVGKLSKWKFLSKVPSLFKGDIYRHKEVRHTLGRQVEISAAPFSYIEVDGEPAGVTPVRIDVIPAGIQVVSNL
ncbi:MAG: diacylglycerol kinase family lipid kinase [Bacteroidales bacterium]|nr:diacylglycerol kinase family lipid kinase [Bacteroidales bacterium]